jgi:hypothetical protein
LRDEIQPSPNAIIKVEIPTIKKVLLNPSGSTRTLNNAQRQTANNPTVIAVSANTLILLTLTLISPLFIFILVCGD